MRFVVLFCYVLCFCFFVCIIVKGVFRPCTVRHGEGARWKVFVGWLVTGRYGMSRAREWWLWGEACDMVGEKSRCKAGDV